MNPLIGRSRSAVLGTDQKPCRAMSPCESSLRNRCYTHFYLPVSTSDSTISQKAFISVSGGLSIRSAQLVLVPREQTPMSDVLLQMYERRGVPTQIRLMCQSLEGPFGLLSVSLTSVCLIPSALLSVLTDSSPSLPALEAMLQRLLCLRV